MSNIAPKTVTTAELITIFSRLLTATPASITAVTSPAMNKGGNPFYGRIQKVETRHVMFNFNYTNSVNNQRGKEGIEVPFQAHKRVWGEKIEGTPLVQHKGKFYVEAKPSGKAQVTTWLCDGSPIELSEIQKYLVVPKKSNLQGTEKEIRVRDYSIDSIAEVKIQGRFYIVS